MIILTFSLVNRPRDGDGMMVGPAIVELTTSISDVKKVLTTLRKMELYENATELCRVRKDPVDAAKVFEQAATVEAPALTDTETAIQETLQRAAHLPTWALNREDVLQMGVLKPLSVQRITQSGQDAEDVYAWENYFFQLGGGTFVEVGALDGVKFSNALSFERDLGFRGLGIEAEPTSYASHLINRPLSISVNAAVCRNRQRVHFSESIHSCCHGIVEVCERLLDE